MKNGKAKNVHSTTKAAIEAALMTLAAGDPIFRNPAFRRAAMSVLRDGLELELEDLERRSALRVVK